MKNRSLSTNIQYVNETDTGHTAEMASIAPRKRARSVFDPPNLTALNNRVTIQVLDESILKKVEQFYSDDGRLKRIQKSSKLKIHKQLKCLQFLPILSPDNLWIILWKTWIMLISIIYFFEIPAYICFGDELYVNYIKLSNQYFIIQNSQESYRISTQLLVNLSTLALMFFIIDLFIGFITAYFLHGNPVVKHGKIALNYLLTDFFFDLIAVKFYSFYKFKIKQQDIVFALRLYKDIGTDRWVYLFFYLKLPALIKIDEHLLEIFLIRRKLRLFHMVVRILVLLFGCINLFCCAFYAVGSSYYARSESTWLNNDGNFGIIGELPMYKRYFFSFYFSMGTLTSTMGYGDITPMNPFEVSLAIVGMMFGIQVFIFNMNLIYDIVQEYNDVQRQVIII